MKTQPEKPTAPGGLADAPCSARRALELCEIWTKHDIERNTDPHGRSVLRRRLSCIEQGIADLDGIPETQESGRSSLQEVLAAVVRKHYDQIEDPKGVDGAQMWNGQWWMPTCGCDTLGNMLDDMAYAIERQQNADRTNAKQVELGCPFDP